MTLWSYVLKKSIKVSASSGRNYAVGYKEALCSDVVESRLHMHDDLVDRSQQETRDKRKLPQKHSFFHSHEYNVSYP